ncbi:MAG: DEAD/DEAH box helicase family protein [Planctomycetia bacterium]|nr:DEAD/DEAH box helicase family protein [Candidatus Brocadia sp.]QOJ05096.1 MAG: DEAD/DEAH box helicase family protein [Planctomycetia bacterium]
MLRKLNLLPVYDSSEYDLIHDLIVPLLRNSTSYLRGVGFFTSGWLKLAAHGLTKLIQNGGKAKIVISPILEKSDWEAFQLGEEAKYNETLKCVLEKNIDDIVLALESDTLNALAWMISDEILEFRFAVPREGFSSGDYHDKVGVFMDTQGDSVAIHGSFNDTFKGSLNGEAFSVFKSWEDAQSPFVDQHYKRLKKLWDGGNKQFKVFTIPEAIRQKFIKLRKTSYRPYSIDKNTPTYRVPDTNKPHNTLKLYPFQENAVNHWISANCKGIFEMATGTGKTITSLAAAVNRYEMLGKLALIILVPYLHLLEQWERNCRELNFSPVLCSGVHENWLLEVKSKIQDFNINAIDNICMLVTHATAAIEKFVNATKGLKPEYTMIIGDEVHGLGTPILRQALISNAGMRLGLSATPRRWFDDEGTKVLFSYFGDVCFEFPLEKAIGTYLTPYEYRPALVNLNSDEMDLYEELTNKISNVVTMLNNCSGKTNSETEEILKKLLLERARLVVSAEEKLERLLNILKEMIQDANEKHEELSHILVYCAPGTHKDVLRAIASLGLKCHEFVHTVTLNERQRILEEFANGYIQVIVAVKCLDEGVDVPATKIAFFLASTSNPKEFVQRRGRILRLSTGKRKSIIYAFIVVPRPEYISLKRDVDASLLRREMPRFAGN